LKPVGGEGIRTGTVSLVVFFSQRVVLAEAILEEVLAWRNQQRDRPELVVAIDGNHSKLHERLRPRLAGEPSTKLLILNVAQGQLATIWAGVAASAGDRIVTVPGYPQVTAASITAVLAELREGVDYVVGYRTGRRDSGFNLLTSRIFNRLIRGATGLRFRDIACGLHALTREAAERIPHYGDNHMFMPILAGREGLHVVETPVEPHPGERRVRLFTPTTYFRRLLSVASLAFLMRFTQKPLRPFGAIGVVLVLAGVVLGLVLVFQRFFGNQPMAERPMLLLALLLVTAGIQVVVLGLLGELLLYLHFRDQVQYRIAEKWEGGSEERSA
jgi:CTP:molybdopterin cytidylyltransferase MocA